MIIVCNIEYFNFRSSHLVNVLYKNDMVCQFEYAKLQWLYQFFLVGNISIYDIDKHFHKS